MGLFKFRKKKDEDYHSSNAAKSEKSSDLDRAQEEILIEEASRHSVGKQGREEP